MTDLRSRSKNLPLLYRELKKSGFLLKKGSKDYTHTAYDSWIVPGPLRVGDIRKRTLFLGYYCDSYKEYKMDGKAPLYLNETANGLDIIPVYFDWDVYLEKVTDPDQKDIESAFLKIPIAQLVEVLNELFVGSEYQVLVSTSGFRLLENKMKIGYHIIVTIPIWNKNLEAITRYIANRFQVALALEWEGFELKSTSPWGSVFDANRAKNPAQRMLGSRNLKKCKECSSKTKTCEQKDHWWGFDTGTEHQFLHAYDQTGEILPEEEKKLSGSLHDALLAMSLRQYEWKEIKPFEVDLAVPEQKKVKAKAISDQPRIDALKWFVHYYTKYKVFGDIQFNKKTRTFLFSVTTDRCPNKLVPHTSSTQYMVVSPAGASIRCYCQKEVEHIWGKCHEFAQDFPLPPRLRAFLFDIKQEKRKADTTLPEKPLSPADRIAEKYKKQKTEQSVTKTITICPFNV